jgi:hypothetical protein
MSKRAIVFALCVLTVAVTLRKQGAFFVAVRVGDKSIESKKVLGLTVQIIPLFSSTCAEDIGRQRT